MARTKTRHVRHFGIAIADAIVSRADFISSDLDIDLLHGFGNCFEFGFHKNRGQRSEIRGRFTSASSALTSDRRPLLSVTWCERGDSNPHTFRYQILSLARLPIPPLSHVLMLLLTLGKNSMRYSC